MTQKQINIEIGANIKRQRELAGMTQDRLSELAGIGEKSLSAVERGVVGISLSTLKRICVVLGVTSDSIIFGDGDKNDVGQLAEKLERLSPEQFRIASDVISRLMEAFAMEKS